VERTGASGPDRAEDAPAAPRAVLPPPSPVLATTRLVALLGDPVAHSRSPAIHNAAFRALGLDLVYVACRVTPGALPAAVAGLRALGAAGANVTVPHKEPVVLLVDRLSPAAAATRAVNTIVPLADGAFEGDNTDVAGFLDPLGRYAPLLRGQEAVILGAGGAARAAAYALLTTLAPSRLTVVGRTTQRAGRLAAELSSHDAHEALCVMAPDDARRAVRRATLVVNATPAGMHPHVEATPWPDADDFSAGQLVSDLVYAPPETRLLREAAARGAATLDGRAMLLAQAAAAFERWTGRAMPLDVARAALDAA
jgi:shikimate dehydrogenase